MRSESVALFIRFGFQAGRNVFQPEQSMRQFVRRDEIALHLVERGGLRVLFAAGGTVTLGPNRLMVSWGGFPHRAEWLKRNTVMHDIILPLGWVMEWGLPQPFMQDLLTGKILLGPEEAEGRHDRRLMTQWTTDIPRGDADLTRIALLEVEARMRRLARDHTGPRHAIEGHHSSGRTRLGDILRYIADNLTRPIRVADIARAAGLHAAYLSRLFAREVGIGPASYLAQCRVAHAQALLVRTDMKISEILERSGFGSASRFHVAFHRHAGCTPAKYRVRHWPKA